MNHTTEVVTELTYDDYTVQAVYVRWAGGGESYEFRVLDGANGLVLYTSENGYGQALPALADAYQYLQQRGRRHAV